MDSISLSARPSAPWATIVADRSATEDTTGEVIPLLAHDLRTMAANVLRGNDKGGYTVPSQATYPHQWNWDSALAALGWAELDPARAWTELETLAGARDGQGMIPHIAFHTRVPDRVNGRLRGILTSVVRPYARYLPGPRWWGKRFSVDGRRVSGITQPPLAATCMRMLFEAHPDEERARALLRPLLGWHRFLLEERDPRGMGEPVLIHPWESGRDNSVEWDAPLWRVMPEVSVVHRRDTHSVDAAERPTDEHYRRFLSLVRRGTEAGWAQTRLARSGPFRVLDPGFSGILARACHDLAWLAERLGEPRIAEESSKSCERVAAALRARADSDGLIRALDMTDESTLEVTSAGSALAAMAPGLEEAQVRAVSRLVTSGALASPYGVRSLDRDHPERSPRNYWRGPVWTNITWLSAWALEHRGDADAAAMLRGQMLAAVEGGGMREYFVPDSGRGLGARDFAWTAALTLRELAAGAAAARDEAAA
jgi:Glycosyl hydrolase family 63 C-terminal domain